MSGMPEIRRAGSSCAGNVTVAVTGSQTLTHPRRATRGHSHRLRCVHSASAQRKQNHASTPQDPPTADGLRLARLSTVPESPTATEPVAMSTTAATSSPDARGGVWTWLRARWRDLFVRVNNARQARRMDTLRHFREFTVPAHLLEKNAAIARPSGQRAPRGGTRPSA